jgi:hypothetical protein
MGTSAQIASFRVVTDQGETFGPFDLADASAVHYFDVDLTAKRLRFETVDSSGEIREPWRLRFTANRLNNSETLTRIT